MSRTEFILLNAFKFWLNEADFLYLLISLIGFDGINKKLQYMFGNWNAKFFLAIFSFFFHPWLLSIAILMIKVFSKSRILQKKIFPIWNFYFRLTEVIFRNYFILARESPKILFKSLFCPWQKANFPSLTMGTFFYWSQNLNYFSPF